MSLDPAAGAAPRTGKDSRLPWLDAARGIALLAMAVYHFTWDLRYFGYISVDPTQDLGWVIFARLIAGSFLFLVGVSLVLATRRGFRRRAFLSRLARVAGGAAAITAVTFFVFPDSFIFFGILHEIALASVLALPFLRLPVALVLAAAAFFLGLPHVFSEPLYDHPALIWVGLGTFEPRSNDYVPVFPWFGVVLLGLAAARFAPRLARSGGDARRAPRGAPGAPRDMAWRAGLAWAGRHSLVIYLLHQPALFGLVFLAAQVIPVPPSVREANYLESCVNFCVGPGSPEDVCRRACTCVAAGLEARSLWDPVMSGTLSPAQSDSYYGLAAECRAAAERGQAPLP